MEIIVINDASTDNSVGIIKEYRSIYPNLRLIDCKKNLGLASVRNLGMRLARGTYIGFVDGDDWADPRKYDLMCHRAERDDADIVFARNEQFLDDSKWFIRANDHCIWKALSADLKQRVFRAVEEPRVFVIEPAVWAKLYKRAFLEEHQLEFEEGMNSVEDVIFHFAVLWKAKRVSLLDISLSFYRLNRPGQITGRRDRRVFETITVFDKTSENLAAWNVPDEIWASLLSTALRFFQWLLKDRVPAHLRRSFFAECARHLQAIPDGGFRAFARRSDLNQLLELVCMRRNWLCAYDIITTRRGLQFVFMYAFLPLGRPGHLKYVCRKGMTMLRQRLGLAVRSLTKESLNLAELEKRIQTMTNGLNEIKVKDSASLRDEPLAEVHPIGDQTLFLSSHSYNSGLGEAVWRIENDYYLAQTAVFRQGDVIVDVGAHVGVLSIYLAKKYPFVRVYAIEPDFINYTCLLRNIELNGVTNVTAINQAISGNCQDKTLYVDAWNSAWATIDPIMALSRSVLRTMQVSTLTLEQLFQAYGIRHCRLMKITAPGAIDESLKSFKRRDCVDFLCGEADLGDCSRVKLQMASWRIARQHFWRTVDGRTNPTVQSWIHQAATGIERIPHKLSSPVRPIDLKSANSRSGANSLGDPITSGKALE